MSPNQRFDNYECIETKKKPSKQTNRLIAKVWRIIANMYIYTQKIAIKCKSSLAYKSYFFFRLNVISFLIKRNLCVWRQFLHISAINFFYRICLNVLLSTKEQILVCLPFITDCIRLLVNEDVRIIFWS